MTAAVTSPRAVPRVYAEWIAAVIIAAAVAGTLIHLADWPAGTQPDELKKARFILSGTQDFHHPVLPLQISRIANFFLGYTDQIETLRLGRIFSAIFGGLTVLATFVLARMVVAPLTAMAASLAVAVTALFAVNATFLKEDIYLAAPAILGLAALVALVDRPSKSLAMVIGFAFGVATSAKLVGALFLAYAMVVVLVAGKEQFRRRFLDAGLILLTAVITFLVINATALIDYATVIAAMERETGRASGELLDVPLPIWLTGGVMNLRDHILPGIGLPLTVLGVAGLSAPFFDRTHRTALAIIAFAAMLWYLVHEIAPLKFPRYMVPIVPLLVVLGASLIESLFRPPLKHWSPIAAAVVLIACASPAAAHTYEIMTTAGRDPRAIMPKLIEFLPRQTRVDPYVFFDSRLDEALTRRADRSEPLDMLATSSFYYDRFGRYADDPSQSQRARAAHNFYFNKAFRHPYLELASGPTYRYLNPTIRIVALDDNIDRLLVIGQAVIAVDPHIQLTIGPE